MTDSPAPANTAGSPQARFELVPGDGNGTAVVRAAGDIDLSNVAQFEAALLRAAAFGGVTADMTAVTYCDSAAIRALFLIARQSPLTIVVSAAGSVTPTLIRVSGLDQAATVVTVDLQDRDRVDRRAGPVRQPQRRDDAAEGPAACRLA